MSGSLGLRKGWEQERRVCDGKRTAGTPPGIGRCFCLACTSGDVVLGFCQVSPLGGTGKGCLGSLCIISYICRRICKYLKMKFN